MSAAVTHGKKKFAESFNRRLPDFTQWRIPQMDEAGVDVQVLSHTVPAIQQDLEAAQAAALARTANDYIAGHYLDEPQFDELWAALAELQVPLYLHPGIPPTEPWALLGGHPELSGALWSWAATAGGHAMRIVMGGVFDRHPGATLILGHIGEFLPFQTSRFDSRYATLDPTRPWSSPPPASSTRPSCGPRSTPSAPTP
ncbi:MAG: amidohydrolase family protein [Actinobacteria bacterium]|nr:amidohydrolase family protein [Actinomycetota bacterium]